MRAGTFILPLRYHDIVYLLQILILTLSHSAPAVIRFLVCALTIYFGYTFTGWTVLGPYSQKVRSSLQKRFIRNEEWVEKWLKGISIQLGENKIWSDIRLSEQQFNKFRIVMLNKGGSFLRIAFSTGHMGASRKSPNDSSRETLRTLTHQAIFGFTSGNCLVMETQNYSFTESLGSVYPGNHWVVCTLGITG